MSFKNNYSPLRYPGGKAAIADFFVEILDKNGISAKGTYCEPFAGGAGAALTLLLTGRVSNIIINDYDKCIASFWKSVIYDTDDFVELIKKTDITLDNWEIQRQIYDASEKIDIRSKKNRLALAFATFFLNRCNRAGILPKAGPIGGRTQAGKYKIDARFIKEKLISRIQAIAQYKTHITVTHYDAIDFLKKLPRLTDTQQDCLLYLDPPYYHNGEKLYLNAYSHDDHVKLANEINTFDFCQWIMTYDNCEEIVNIYSQFPKIKIELIPINYSMQKVRKSTEILIHK